jgi:redox-sensitive bicupin YhaK (pirin superfamily)
MLTSLPTSGRELRLGETVLGRLTGAEATIADDRPVQAWTLQGMAGETLTVRLESDDFDAYLYLFGPGMTETLSDDDGGGDLDSELTVTFPETGSYTVGAAALSSGAVGAYSLTAMEPIDLATLATADRRLRVGSTVSGILTTADPVAQGKPVQAWALEARAGQLMTIELLSDDFDAYLQVAGPGFPVPLTNDDGGDDLNSRLDVSFPEGGVYRVIASSLGGSTGTFTLRVR